MVETGKKGKVSKDTRKWGDLKRETDRSREKGGGEKQRAGKREGEGK